MPPPLRAAARFGIAYRAEREEDEPFLRALYASTRAEEVAASGWPATVQQAFLEQQFRAQLLDYRSTYRRAEWLVIERAGEPIGRIYLDEMDGPIRIIDISLLPAERGAGLGTAILKDVLAAGRAAGKGASLHVLARSPARRLYERLGFRQVAEAGLYVLMERPPPASKR